MMYYVVFLDIHTYIYVCIYIYRERESMCAYVCFLLRYKGYVGQMGRTVRVVT